MAQYNSKHTGSQIDSAVARALAGGAIDQAIAKKMDATEIAPSTVLRNGSTRP